MRPTKNRVYCYGCQRSKMLFESKAKADNFIAYNSEGIMEENGKAPVRSYYCELCGGYHVTSNPSMIAGESLNQRDQKMGEQISNYKKGAEDYKQMHQVVSNQIDMAKRQMYLGNFEYIEELYETKNCRKILVQVYSSQTLSRHYPYSRQLLALLMSMLRRSLKAG